MRDGQTEIGDVIRDPITGRLYDVVQVLRPNDLEQFTRHGSYRGGSSERCAMFGSGTVAERTDHRRRMNQSRLRVQAHKGAA